MVSRGNQGGCAYPLCGTWLLGAKRIFLRLQLRFNDVQGNKPDYPYSAAVGYGLLSSMVDPSFGVLCKFGHGLGEIPIGEVGERDGLKDGAKVGADGDPDLLQGFGGARVLDGLWVLAPDVG